MPNPSLDHQPVESSLAASRDLAPSYRLPLGLGAIAGGVAWIAPWPAVIIAVLAVFLGFQAATLRLRFTDTALDIYRGETRLRSFPYVDWQHWEIFWSPVPVLFYFREVNSIHFLPILFAPSQLRSGLEQHCPRPLAAEADLDPGA